jgi:hypothetical protein
LLLDDPSSPLDIELATGVQFEAAEDDLCDVVYILAADDQPKEDER